MALIYLGTFLESKRKKEHTHTNDKRVLLGQSVTKYNHQETINQDERKNQYPDSNCVYLAIRSGLTNPFKFSLKAGQQKLIRPAYVPEDV